eukprot:COSAG06_NODE_33656_length_486_cov_1.188630_1_plen_120_part_01
MLAASNQPAAEATPCGGDDAPQAYAPGLTVARPRPRLRVTEYAIAPDESRASPIKTFAPRPSGQTARGRALALDILAPNSRRPKPPNTPSTKMLSLFLQEASVSSAPYFFGYMGAAFALV